MEVSVNGVTVKAVHNSGSLCSGCVFNSVRNSKGCLLVHPKTELQKAAREIEKSSNANCSNYIWVQV